MTHKMPAMMVFLASSLAFLSFVLRPESVRASAESGTLLVVGQQQRGPHDRGGHPRPDFKAAAKKLGIEESELRDALGDPSQGPPDLTAAAKKLGVSEDELREAFSRDEFHNAPMPGPMLDEALRREAPTTMGPGPRPGQR